MRMVIIRMVVLLGGRSQTIRDPVSRRRPMIFGWRSRRSDFVGRRRSMEMPGKHGLHCRRLFTVAKSRKLNKRAVIGHAGASCRAHSTHGAVIRRAQLCAGDSRT